MKKIDRAILRGKPVDEDCNKAKRTTHEWGQNDNRIFCYGLIDIRHDEVMSKCTECGAYVCNAISLGGKQ